MGIDPALEQYRINLLLYAENGQLSATLSGLNLLLGSHYLGGGIDIHGNETHTFDLAGPNFRINGVPMTTIKNRCDIDLSDKPVVVLIGPVTRSSGSIVAIAFKQRPNTFFIGEPTADGYSTGNDFFYFGAALTMNLSTTFQQDRGKIVYKNAVPPDLVLKDGDNFEALPDDLKVREAVNWIKSDRR